MTDKQLLKAATAISYWLEQEENRANLPGPSLAAWDRTYRAAFDLSSKLGGQRRILVMTPAEAEAILLAAGNTLEHPDAVEAIMPTVTFRAAERACRALESVAFKKKRY